MKKRNLFLAALMALSVISSYSQVNAQEKLGACSQREKIAVKKHITGQISALGKSNWQSAYNYAALAFQQTVPLDYFKEIITKQYFYLISNDGYTFGDCTNTPDGINQFLTVNYHGAKRILLYGLTVVDKRLGIAGASEAKTPTGVAA